MSTSPSPNDLPFLTLVANFKKKWEGNYPGDALVVVLGYLILEFPTIFFFNFAITAAAD